MRGQDRVVGLHNRVGHGGSRIHAELELRLFAIVGGETLQDEGTKTGPSSASERVENKETLKARAVIGQTTNFIHDEIDLFFTDGIVTTCI